ncbi:MAG: response regulator [Fibromonadaceae bacterium]|jgi:putative two-component system response regulator|nr:response regulator [Fibromonadaceae bacterium]
MKTVFIVDDADTNLAKAKQSLEDSYRVLTMPSATKMFALLEKIIPDLILLDIEMPEMNGFVALEKLMQNEKTAKIPVVFLTAQTDAAVESRGFEMGAVDFITKPFSEPVLLNRINSHLHLADIIKKRTQHIERLQTSIVSVLADMVEGRDEITGGHVERTTRYVNILLRRAMSVDHLYAEEMRSWDFDQVVSSAKLHDVGKITISDLILNKPGKLSPEEFEIMKTHAIEGEKIIDKIIEQTGEDTFLRHAKLFAGYHHERWDGQGYPYGLKGEDIPLQGRIMAVADVYDALTSERPYKKAFSHERSTEIIMENAGTQFDPSLAKLFYEVKDKFEAINSSKQ